jgi:hypothetical protein
MNTSVSAHNLLVQSDARRRWGRLAEKLGCEIADFVTEDGGELSFDVSAFLRLMRARRYVVSEPGLMPVSADQAVYGVMVYHHTWQSCVLLALPEVRT